MQPVFKLKSIFTATALLVSLSTSVSAQQSNQQASLMLEFQSLRQEVAELRDMVERQQFQIRKLQQQNAALSTNTMPAQTQASTTMQLPTETQAQTETNQQPWQVSEQTSSQQAPSQQSSTNYPTSNQTRGYQQPRYSDNANQSNVPASSSPSNDSDYYRQSVPSNAEQVKSAREYNQQQSARQYPPVVDRSIGGSSQPANPQQAEGSHFEPAPTEQNRGYSSRNPDASRAPVPSGFPDSRPDSGGVIAVPRVNESQPQASRSQVNTMPQQSAVENKALLSEADFYQQGFDLLSKSKEDQAMVVFKQQLESYPNGEYAADAYFWIADSMYVNRKLDESKKNFRQIMDNFKQSPRVPFAMLKTAYIEQEQGNVIEARMLLQEIIQHYPQSDAAISAKNRIATLK